MGSGSSVPRPEYEGAGLPKSKFSTPPEPSNHTLLHKDETTPQNQRIHTQTSTTKKPSILERRNLGGGKATSLHSKKGHGGKMGLLGGRD